MTTQDLEILRSNMNRELEVARAKLEAARMTLDGLTRMRDAVEKAIRNMESPPEEKACEEEEVAE